MKREFNWMFLFAMILNFAMQNENENGKNFIETGRIAAAANPLDSFTKPADKTY